MRSRSSTHYILAAGLLLTMGIGVYAARRAADTGSSPGKDRPVGTDTAGEVYFLEKGEFPSFVSGAMEPGNVRLELSPEGFEKDRFKVRYFANAHDLALDAFDLSVMTTLQYGERNLRPTRSDPMKGHHDSGLIYFDLGKIHDPGDVSTFTITVRGLPGEEIRVYRWE